RGSRIVDPFSRAFMARHLTWADRSSSHVPGGSDLLGGCEWDDPRDRPYSLPPAFDRGVQMWGLRTVLLHGASMAPPLRHGAAVLTRRVERPVRPGDVVVARFHARPDLLVVKRALHRDGDGWWL